VTLKRYVKINKIKIIRDICVYPRKKLEGPVPLAHF